MPMADPDPPSRAISARFEPYPEYKDSAVGWLGAIPAHWDVAALRYRYEQTLGKMLDTKRITGEHLVPYLRNVDVQWDRINCTDLPSMDIRPHEIERFTVRPGDLLVCEGGETGRCAIWQGEVDPCGYQKALHRLRPLDRVRDMPRFLYYTLLAAVMRGAFAEGQGSTIGHLTGDMLRAHRFPFPSGPEQRAVADFLDRETAKIDALVTKQEQLIDLLREKHVALISHAVTGGLDDAVPRRDSGVRWFGQVPAGWEVRRLGSIGQISKCRGGTKAHETSAGVRCVRYGDLYTYHGFSITGSRAFVSSDHAAHYSKIRYGDLLFAASGETIDEIGTSAINLMRGEAVCGGDVILLRPAIPMSARFMGYAANAPYIVHQKSRLGRGMTVMHIYGRQLKEVAMLLPPLSEQRSIADLLERESAKTDAIVAKSRQAIERLDELRSGLISAAVTGKIDVREAAA